jgi:hypothetical protein
MHICVSQEWAGMAAEEAGISKLDNMATAEQRLQTIMNVMLVRPHSMSVTSRLHTYYKTILRAICIMVVLPYIGSTVPQ